MSVPGASKSRFHKLSCRISTVIVEPICGVADFLQERVCNRKKKASGIQRCGRAPPWCSRASQQRSRRHEPLILSSQQAEKCARVRASTLRSVKTWDSEGSPPPKQYWTVLSTFRRTRAALAFYKLASKVSTKRNQRCSGATCFGAAVRLTWLFASLTSAGSVHWSAV